MALADHTRKQIDELVKSHKVMLFMKGNKHFPQCGFSATVVGILKELGVPFEATNVLADPEIRDGIKAYSDWPTIPQLYVDGEFVGGCDIVREMHQNGELATLVGASWTPPAPPEITVTDKAAKAFAEAGVGDEGDVLRLEVSPDFRVDLYFGPPEKGDVVVTSRETTLHVEPGSAKRANGIRIDYVDGPTGAGFKIDNPNEPPRVKQLEARELREMKERGDSFHLFDVRPEGERRLASLDFATALDEAGAQHLASLGTDAKIVLLCHHGHRSQAAAERLLAEGYTNVYNVRGGIAAYADVDATIPRY